MNLNVEPKSDQLATIEPDEDDQAFWHRMANEWEKQVNLAVRPDDMPAADS